MNQKDKLKQGQEPQGLSQTDKEYYNDLYQDLPQEVQDILMQTHPLMGKNEKKEKNEKNFNFIFCEGNGIRNESWSCVVRRRY